MFGDGIADAWIMTLVTYALMVLLPRNHQHKFVFVWTMGYLSYQHISRMYSNWGGWDMDITSFTMCLTCKLSSLGYCFKDGSRDVSRLSKDQAERKVNEMPSLLEFLSYAFFGGSSLIGPFFEYYDYVQFIKESGRYREVPSTIVPSLIRFSNAQSKFKSVISL